MRLVDLDALIAEYDRVHVGTPGGARKLMEDAPIIDPEDLRPKGRWEDGRCSNCKEEASSTSWDEPVYDYDWEENLRYSHTETNTEYLLTTYCPNCGAKMEDDNG